MHAVFESYIILRISYCIPRSPFLRIRGGSISKPREIRHNNQYILIIAYFLSAAITVIVYLTGGTTRVYSNLMYLPIALASSTNGKKSGIIHAAACGVLLGPFMPLDVGAGIAQDPVNWCLRLLMYIMIAYVIGHFSEYYKREFEKVKKRDNEIIESQMATIFALVKLSESRDKDTGDHILRVAKLCALLADKLRRREKYKDYINGDYVESIFKATPLHDIGKVGISDSILRKPGELTAEEYEIMKTHTTIGESILNEINTRYSEYRFLKLGKCITRHHHEKWDGTGYPDGLKGENIPLSARIMAIADTYDALRSDRVYKEAYSHEKSLKIIKQGAGSHFDPEIVDVFMEYEREIKALYS